MDVRYWASATATLRQNVTQRHDCPSDSSSQGFPKSARRAQIALPVPGSGFRFQACPREPYFTKRSENCGCYYKIDYT